MPTFNIQITRRVDQIATVEVEADCISEARDQVWDGLTEGTIAPDYDDEEQELLVEQV